MRLTAAQKAMLLELQTGLERPFTNRPQPRRLEQFAEAGRRWTVVRAYVSATYDLLAAGGLIEWLPAVSPYGADLVRATRLTEAGRLAAIDILRRRGACVSCGSQDRSLEAFGRAPDGKVCRNVWHIEGTD